MPASELTYSWILDSGGAGRGAWQGGVVHELMHWARQQGCYPRVSMGASAGGYAAADVATGTEATVLKGWTRWGQEKVFADEKKHPELRSFWGLGEFRLHLVESIRYVMAEQEVTAVFDGACRTKLLIFTTRVRRRDQSQFKQADCHRYFCKAITRKLPRPLKYLPKAYIEEPVVFATHLPPELRTEHVRPLTRSNYHSVIEASCLVPLAMGFPLRSEQVNCEPCSKSSPGYIGDQGASFIDGSFVMKMPMGYFEEDPRFQGLAKWAAADKTIVFCCDPKGNLWETSSRLRLLNAMPQVAQAIRQRRMFIICPDHPIDAGFLCCDNVVTMRAFRRGQEQAQRLLHSDSMKRFLEP